jgi:protein-disulfide isomerase
MAKTQPRRGRQVTVKRSSTTIIFWVVGALLLVGSAALVFFAATNNSKASNANISSLLKSSYNAPMGTLTEPYTYTNAEGKEITVAAGTHYIGDPNAPVKVIEYADFQCPACASFNATSEDRLFRNYIETGRVQFIYHEFPLMQHQHAKKAAEAARCAGDQNMFWQMHDVLFKRQALWADLGDPTSTFSSYARDLGLDTAKFDACLNGGTYTAQIDAAQQASADAQIPATPTFIVNGQQTTTMNLFAYIDQLLAGN